MTASKTFKVQNHKINPGLSSVFPWASQLVNSFESYSFDRLEFSFLPSVGTDTAGNIIISVDYDPNDPPPSSAQEMLSTQGAVRSSVWQTARLRCPKNNLHKHTREKYTRRGLRTITDLINYDVGSISISASGDEGQYVGDLFVSYDIVLKTPQLLTDSTN